LKFENFQDYLNDLEKDSSHIAFKFHQAINFLKHDYAIKYEEAKNKVQIHEIEKSLESITDASNIINFVPPSFLKVDVIFSTINENDSFNKLSSGEKQKIYSMSSMTYHLRYIDSVKRNGSVKYKYQNINLIFDEIELYYHPELQRNFIYDFREAVKHTPLNSIRNINCIFVTHSPFILSDIPSVNIMYLEADDKTKKSKQIPNDSQTFGSNIHDLLANDFFMKNGFMGEFAKNTINKIIDSLKYYSIKNEIDNIEKEKKREDSKIKLKELTGVFNVYDINGILSQEKCKKIISLIGEPILYNGLLELYSKAFPEDTNNFIDEQIQKLENLRV
jgi:hypothetical protein